MSRGANNDLLMNGNFKKNDQYRSDFLKRLDSLREKDISFNGYPREYLFYLLKYKAHYVSIYQRIIEVILKKTDSAITDIVFVDYGTGNGLLAMFARLLPFHKVIAIDVDKDFVAAARRTADMISITGIEFINGGEEVLTKLNLQEKTFVLAATDVIEHIYDLDFFFKQLAQISSLSVFVFTTASNPENPRIVNSLMKLQRREELIGGDSSDRALFGYEHKSFLELREDIISNIRPSLDKKMVNQLAKLSRGLRKDAIEKMLLAYENNGELPGELAHPTNTCHPETGSWSERLVELDEYENYYKANGFKFEIVNGFYDSKKGTAIRRFFIGILNSVINTFPMQAIKIAPFIFLIGTRDDLQSSGKSAQSSQF